MSLGQPQKNRLFPTSERLKIFHTLAAGLFLKEFQ